MPTVRFGLELAEGAEDDLEAILDRVASNRSPAEASRLRDAFIETAVTLEHLPLRGSIPPELEALGLREFRQVLMAPYRIIYRPVGDKVFILVIADGRRDMQSLLERRLLRR